MGSNKKNDTIPIILTILMIIFVTAAYFALGNQNKGMGKSKADPAIYEGINFKAAYTEEGSLDIYAFARNNALAKYKTSMGDPVPEKGTIVLGAVEGMMMKEENLFSKPGDTITEVPGIIVTVGGVLRETDSPVDKFHFLSESSFRELRGDENTIFVKLNEEQMPKMFYVYPLNKNTPLKFELAEGDISEYTAKIISDKTYYPLIIGSKEAKMMREEKLFAKTGDRIDNLFGQNFVVVGIIAETNTSLDMMHLIPLTESELS